jgi:hypothetical protein
MRMASHIALRGGGGAIMVLVGEPEETRPLDGRIILSWIFMKWDEAGLIWLRLGSGCGLL